MVRQNLNIIVREVFRVLVIYALIAFTPIRGTIPGYPNAHTRKMAVNNAMKMDSLESAMARWELYAKNLSRVLSGEKPLRHDSLLRANPIALLSEVPDTYLQQRDSALREKVQATERFQIGSNVRDLPIEGMLFFTPLKGVIFKDFDVAIHPAVDIQAPKGSVVSSVYQGTVVFSGWDDDLGYIMIIQHPNDVLSTYEHCEKLLVKTGDKVKAGTPIALVGDTGAKIENEHLHFSLWSKGEAMNPVKYINF